MDTTRPSRGTRAAPAIRAAAEDDDRPLIDAEPAVNRAQNDVVDPRVDGPWAWLVVVSSLLNIVLVDGISFTVASLQLRLKDHFQTDVSLVNLVGSLLAGTYMSAGPLVSALSERFGYRTMALAGSLLSSSAFFASSFSPNIEVMIVLYGFVAGLGFCCLYLTSMVMTTLYFEQKRPLAVGIASCGSGIGMLVLAPLLDKLLGLFSWQDTVRIQAGMMLLGFFASLSFRPLRRGDEVGSRRTFKDALKSVIDTKLLRNPVFAILLAMAVTASMGIYITVVYEKDLALERSVSDEQATSLQMITGITNTVARVLVGAIVYKTSVHPLIILAFSSTLGGIATILSFLYKIYALFAAYAVVVGLVYALDAALTTVIISRLLGVASVSGAFGLQCLFRGVAVSVTGLIAGGLHDINKTYDIPFFYAGTCTVLTGIFCIVAWLFSRRRLSADQASEADPLLAGYDAEDDQPRMPSVRVRRVALCGRRQASIKDGLRDSLMDSVEAYRQLSTHANAEW